jgi:hypothetical protein
LSGLAGGQGGGPEPDAQAVETTATPTVTPTPSGLSVQQVASKIATIQATNEKLVKDLEPCGLAASGAEALICSFVTQRAPLEAQTALKTLAIANPPTEVAELLAATRKSALTMSKLSTKACEKSAESVECSVEAFKAGSAAENFQLALAGWQPYL